MWYLPVGDPTLSDKEIIGNESQERMGLLVRKKDLELIRKTAERERAPYYEVGEVTGDERLRFVRKEGEAPIDLALSDFFGSAPKTVLHDTSKPYHFKKISYTKRDFHKYLEKVLQLEAVACKDWLTNKVDRSVTGRVAQQQTVGEVQLPLSNLGISALDYTGTRGIATAFWWKSDRGRSHPRCCRASPGSFWKNRQPVRGLSARTHCRSEGPGLPPGLCK